MKMFRSIWMVLLAVSLSACVTHPNRNESRPNLSLHGFQQQDRQQIEDRIGLDNLRVIECSIRNCEYWYGGALSSGDLYQRLQQSLGKNEMDIPSNITLRNGVIRVSRVGVRRLSDEQRQGDQLNRADTGWVDRW